ncbi:MAG: hypothetical protein J6A53_08945 [Clostridia bacterium]|nr:hypothetical protein [Clostridia bacterium]
MEQGWVKFYREWLDNPIITKDSEHLAVWIYLLANAIYTEKECIFKGQATTLKEGQLLIKQCNIAESLKIDRFKLMRILKCFENAHLIAHQTDKRKTLITLEQRADYQGLNKQQNALPLHIGCTSQQETEKEKEKSSKREKVKEKEINKKERMEEVCVYKEDTHEKPLSLGRYENIFVDKEWLEEFKQKYWYYDKVIDKLSVYKQAKGIANIDDRPYLELFASEDKDKYIKREETFDADDFFEAALKRSYADFY